MNTYALDTETFYSSECSIKPLGLDGYVRHPDFDCYMLTIVGDDGTVYAGRPEAFDWSKLEGQTVLSHNAAFDEGVVKWLISQGKVPAFTPAAWHCTADLAAFLGVPRSLQQAAKLLLGIEVDKGTRDEMKGKRWEDMPEDFRAAVLAYATKDSDLCLKLWQGHGHKWPQKERDISALTRKSASRGFYVDVEGVKADDDKLTSLMGEIEARIPWAGDGALLSFVEFCRAVRSAGLTPPASLDKKDPDTAAWCAQHPEITWVQDMQDYRSANALREKLRSILSRIREDQTIATPLLYFGGHTGRDSGTGGVNFQNLPRGEVLGVNIRKHMRPRPGHVLIAADLSSIEPRALMFLARDFATLEAVSKTDDLYEGQARAWGLYSDPRPLKIGDPELRHKVKGMSIGAGYGMSAAKFAMVTGQSKAEADKVIALFRAKNPKIVQLWGKLEAGLKSSQGGDFTVTLPSGRPLHYRSVSFVPAKTANDRGTLTCLFSKQTMVRMKVWRGTVVENCLGGSTEVLTPRGWVRMDQVSSDDKVWDGDNWVAHQGLVHKGVQEVVDVHGVQATPDHKFLLKSGWTAAKYCRGLAYEHYYYRTKFPGAPTELGSESSGAKRADRTETRESDRAFFRWNQWQKLALACSLRLWERVSDLISELAVGASSTAKFLFAAVPSSRGTYPGSRPGSRQVTTSCIHRMALYEEEMFKSQTPIVEKLRGAWHRGVPAVARFVRALLGGHGPHLHTGEGVGSHRQQPRVFSRELPLGNAEGEFEEHAEELGDPKRSSKGPSGYCREERDSSAYSVQTAERRGSMGACGDESPGSFPMVQVYDLLNAGPQHRFAVRGSADGPVLMASNCTQAFARDIFMDRVLAIEAAGYPVILRVHDEVVCEVPEHIAAQAEKDIAAIMSSPVPYAPQLPLASSVKTAYSYYDAK